MKLPDSMRVICRGWLNANHVLFRHQDANVLIDSGYVTYAQRTLQLLCADDALGQAPLDQVIVTHCHSDHMGGNATLQRAYRCQVLIAEAEREHIRNWDSKALWLDVAGQQAEPFEVSGTIAAGDTLQLGGTAWQAIAAPGHRMEALMFYSPEFKLLISGDALWQNGLGVVEPTEDDGALKAAFATLDTIAGLDVDWVIPGHGWPFADVPQVVERARQRLQGLHDDPVKMAKSMLKALLVFNLLEQERMSLAALPGYLESLWFYREFNRRYLSLPTPELADMLVAELERAGVATRRGDWLLPLIPA